MKILCICEGGNVRSVALAQHLKEIGWEAIAIGWKYTSKETLLMLIRWADKIIDVREYLPEDLWHNPRHPELKQKVEEIWKLEEKHL